MDYLEKIYNNIQTKLNFHLDDKIPLIIELDLSKLNQSELNRLFLKKILGKNEQINELLYYTTHSQFEELTHQKNEELIHNTINREIEFNALKNNVDLIHDYLYTRVISEFNDLMFYRINFKFTGNIKIEWFLGIYLEKENVSNNGKPIYLPRLNYDFVRLLLILEIEPEQIKEEFIKNTKNCEEIKLRIYYEEWANLERLYFNKKKDYFYNTQFSPKITPNGLFNLIQQESTDIYIWGIIDAAKTEEYLENLQIIKKTNPHILDFEKQTKIWEISGNIGTKDYQLKLNNHINILINREEIELKHIDDDLLKYSQKTKPKFQDYPHNKEHTIHRYEMLSGWQNLYTCKELQKEITQDGVFLNEILNYAADNHQWDVLNCLIHQTNYNANFLLNVIASGFNRQNRTVYDKEYELEEENKLLIFLKLLFLTEKVNSLWQDNHKNNLLHLFGNRKQIGVFLIQQGVDLLATNKHGYSPKDIYNLDVGVYTEYDNEYLKRKIKQTTIEIKNITKI